MVYIISYSLYAIVYRIPYIVVIQSGTYFKTQRFIFLNNGLSEKYA